MEKEPDISLVDILAESLGPGPCVYRSQAHEVELELQAGSLHDKLPRPVKVTPSLQFVECRTEGPGRWDDW